MDDLTALTVQIEWGADEALDPASLNRLRPVALRAHPAQDVPSDARSARVSPEATSAAAAADFAEWLEQLGGADGAGLAATATHLVPPVGCGFPGAGRTPVVLVLADAPAEEEDRSGLAFQGPAGQLARRMLASILPPERTDDLMLAYLVPWRPPGGRAPSEREIAACLPSLHRLISLARPPLILAMGSVPAKALLRGQVRRGQFGLAEIPGGAPVPTLPTANPVVLLRQPAQKAAVWSDLRLLRRRTDRLTTL